MLDIVGVEVSASEYTVTVNSFQAALPENHASGDVFLALVAASSATAPTGPGGSWSQYDTATQIGSKTFTIWKLEASSSSETDPTWTHGSNINWIVTIYCLRGKKASSYLDSAGISRANFSSVTSKATSGSLSATNPDSLVIDACMVTSGVYPTTETNDLFVDGNEYISTIFGVQAGHRAQIASGAIDPITWLFPLSASGTVLTITVAPDVEDGVPVAAASLPTVIKHYGKYDAGSFSSIDAALNLGGGTINGIAVDSTYLPSTETSVIITGLEAMLSRWTMTISGGTALYGHVDTLTTAVDLAGKVVSVLWSASASASSWGADGALIIFADNATPTPNYLIYQLATRRDFVTGGNYAAYVKHIAVGSAAAYASSGTMDWANTKHIGWAQHRTASGSNFMYIGKIMICDGTVLVGGSEDFPIDYNQINKALSAGGQFLDYTPYQGSGQLITKQDVTFGDGSTPTYVDLSTGSMETPAITNAAWAGAESKIAIAVNGGTNDTYKLISAIMRANTRQTLTITDAGAAYLTTNASIIGYDVTVGAVALDTVAFSGCYDIAVGGDLTDCSISTPQSATGVTVTANNKTFDGCTIDLTGTSADYHISLGASVTAFEINGTTLSGTPGTTLFYSALASGTLTITTDGTGTAIADTDVTFIGGSTATAVIASPTTYRGLNFTGLVDGSKVKVFTAGSQTVLFGTDSVTGNAFAFDDSTSGSTTVDYTIQKAGYVPIRVTGAALNSSTVSQAIGRPDTAVNQVIDRAYVASSGLTYGTTAVVTVGTNPTTNPGTKTFALSAASTGQNWYSFWIEQWIDKGDTGEALANVEFPLSPNGPNSFTLNDGWTFSDGATSIAFLTRDGLRYLNTSDVLQKAWAAILTSGAGNNQVRYQQSDGGTTSNGTMVSNEMDQLVQIYDVGVFDYRGYLVLKIQAEGYDQAEANVVTLYGTLEDQLYVVGLTPAANGIATGNPTVTLTLDRGTYNDVTSGKTFGIRIVSAASGEDILRELRYNFGAGGEYPAASGYDGFDWHDLVQVNGADFKTVRGNIYGTAAVKGVVVYSTGTTLHPDFTLFTADDGTTYAPAVTADISITSMPDAGAVPTRLQIINSTATGASAWVANTVYATGAIVKRTTGLGSESTAGLYFRATTGGTSHATTEPTWDTTVGNTTADNTVVWTTYAILYYDADPAATSLTDTYIDGEEFLAGEVAEIRFAEMNDATSFKTYSTEVAITAAGFSALVAEEADGVYATNALDGSAYETTFSPDFANDYMVLDTNTDFAGKAAYAYYCYTLTTSAGMWGFWGGVTALDEGNYRINTAILNMYFDESAGFVKQTDDVRIFRDDGTRPAIDPTTGGHGIEINWRTPVNTIAVGSAVTSQDKTDIIDGVWSRVLPL